MAETIISKRCSKCKKIKRFSEFYKDRTRKDGYRYVCKICQYESLKEYRQTEHGKNICKKILRKYQRTQKGKATKKHYAQSEKGRKVSRRALSKYKQTEKGKEATRRYNEHLRLREPNRIKARNAVNVAIRKGELPSPESLQCLICLKPSAQYHHHKGYAPEYWLDVIALCKACHNSI